MFAIGYHLRSHTCYDRAGRWWAHHEAGRGSGPSWQPNGSLRPSTLPSGASGRPSDRWEGAQKPPAAGDPDRAAIWGAASCRRKQLIGPSGAIWVYSEGRNSVQAAPWYAVEDLVGSCRRANDLVRAAAIVARSTLSWW